MIVQCCTPSPLEGALAALRHFKLLPFMHAGLSILRASKAVRLVAVVVGMPPLPRPLLAAIPRILRMLLLVLLAAVKAI
jgi:hypothetical protein